MVARRNWTGIAGWVSGAVLALLVAQYFLGLWTNVYAPAQFARFDSGSNYPPSLNVHIVNGDLLFLLSVAALVIASFSKRWSLIVPAVLVVLSVYAAGAFGMAFVNSSPNNPVDSFGMGTMFLVALFSDAALLIFAWRARAPGAAPEPTAVPEPT